jgi:hypothetical protein
MRILAYMTPKNKALSFLVHPSSLLASYVHAVQQNRPNISANCGQPNIGQSIVYRLSVSAGYDDVARAHDPEMLANIAMRHVQSARNLANTQFLVGQEFYDHQPSGTRDHLAEVGVKFENLFVLNHDVCLYTNVRI